MLKLKPTKKQLRRYIDLVMEHGRARKFEQGQKFNETDFIAGAMVFFLFCDAMLQLPGYWVFRSLANKSIFDETDPLTIDKPKEPKEPKKRKAKKCR